MREIRRKILLHCRSISRIDRPAMSVIRGAIVAAIKGGVK